VTSFLADSEPLARYTRVPAHSGPVRGLLDVQEGIVSVGGNALRYAKRRGISHWTL
jgi:hypothetical protein